MLCEELSRVWHVLKNSQEELDPEIAQVLYENLWELYL